MQEIISSTKDAVTSIIERVLTTFKGENVSVATGDKLCMAILWLDILGKVHVDINKNVLDILQTSSVSKFTLFFHQLQINLKQIPSFNLATFKILSMADATYCEYLDIGIWSLTKSTTGDTGAFMSKDAPKESTKKMNWKVVHQKDGEKEEKVIGGHNWWWCAKCCRWTHTHTHTILQLVWREAIFLNIASKLWLVLRRVDP